ncbi:nSTAND1 domain-containing NTPase [Rhizobium leguminosarum]|uniref:nSTAND1 domain-containing NTPase n=1 Tax=Rhizobium leguminosarum TaxID=384 RepID=UPI0036F41B75
MDAGSETDHASFPRADRFAAEWRRGVRNWLPRQPHNFITIPYPGLRAFRSELNQFFCGRDRQKKTLKEFFSDDDGEDTRGPRRLSFVVGGSGSGKSSLTRAGLIAERSTIPIKDHWGAWYVAEMRPETDPIGQLQSALWQGVLRPLIDSCFNWPQGSADDVKPVSPRDAATAEARERVSAAAKAAGIEWPRDAKRDLVEHNVRKWLEDQISPGKVDISAPALFEFVTQTLANLDAAASNSERGGPPMVLLHIDQFEEVFRDECSSNGRRALIRLLLGIFNFPPQRLLTVATMRSEELHRFSEYPGMAEVINNSMYLVDLVDDDDIETAIVEPARRMAARWELPLDRERKAPYTAEAIAELRKAYREASGTLEHKADKLPLLQHALPLIWSIAVTEWTQLRNTNPQARLVIDLRHIQALPGWASSGSEDEPKSRLGRCLNETAQATFEEAKAALIESICNSPSGRIVVQQVTNRAQTQAEAAELWKPDEFIEAEAAGILIVALNGLAQLDDRGNAVRRFLPVSSMLDGAAGAERLMKEGIFEADLKAALEAALTVFEDAGLVERLVNDNPERADLYNVSHESLIRNWTKYGNRLKKQRILQRRLYEFSRPDFQLKNHGNYTALSRFLRRHWAEAATALQKRSRDALTLAFGTHSLYGEAWLINAIHQAEPNGKKTPREVLSGRLELLKAAYSNAERWETHRNYFKFLERGVSTVIVALVILSALAIGLFLRTSDLNKQLEMSRVINDAVGVNESRSAIDDRVLFWLITEVRKSYKAAPVSSYSRQVAQDIIEDIDAKVRNIFGTETVVGFTLKNVDLGAGTPVDCTQFPQAPNEPASLPSPVEIVANPPSSGPQLEAGMKCQVGSWELTLGMSQGEPAIFIQRGEKEAPRYVRSADNKLRVSQLKSMKLGEQLMRPKSVMFYDKDGIIAFAVKGLFGDESEFQDLFLWTVSGLVNPDAMTQAHDNEAEYQMKCNKYNEVPTRPGFSRENIQQCTLSGFDFDGDTKADPDLSLDIFRQKEDSQHRCADSDNECQNQVEVSFTNEGNGTKGPQQNDDDQIVRARFIDRGAKIVGAEFKNGWLLIQDVTKAKRRYMVGSDPILEVLKARWSDTVWSDNGKEFGIRYHVPRSCRQLSGCVTALDGKDEWWPGAPTSAPY